MSSSRKPPTKRTAKRPAAKSTSAAKTPAKRAPGRPRKLEIDPELQTRIVEFVKLGAFPERAAVAAGISERTHYLWQSKGVLEREHRDAGKPPRSSYAVFLAYADAIDEAIAVAEIELLKDARKGGAAGSGAMTLLERRFRARWAAKLAPGSGSSAPAGSPAPAATPLDQLEQRRRERAGTK